MKSRNYAKGADQLTVLFLVCALIVVAVVLISLYFSNEQYLLKKDAPRKTTDSAMNFYQGNDVFARKTTEEKEAAKREREHPVHGITSVNDNLEVPISEQLNSLNQKMKELRAEKQPAKQRKRVTCTSVL